MKWEVDCYPTIPSNADAVSGSAEQFLQPAADGKSPYTMFIERMAAALNTEQQYVDVFSVLDSTESGFVDVRFTAHGSPYYNTTKLIGAVLDDTGVSIDTTWSILLCDSSCIVISGVIFEYKIVASNIIRG